MWYIILVNIDKKENILIVAPKRGVEKHAFLKLLLCSIMFNLKECFQNSIKTMLSKFQRCFIIFVETFTKNQFFFMFFSMWYKREKLQDLFLTGDLYFSWKLKTCKAKNLIFKTIFLYCEHCMRIETLYFTESEPVAELLGWNPTTICE